MLRELYLFVSTALGAIPKEAYLFIGTVFGAFVTLIISVSNTRSQLKLARANNEHQYRLETQKLEYQQQKETTEFLRQKLGDADQIVLKIAMEASLTGDHIRSETGVSLAQFHALYLKLDEDVGRLQTMADLYFPPLRQPADELRGFMNLFWGSQQGLMSIDAKHEAEGEQWYSDQGRLAVLNRVIDASDGIADKVGKVRYELRNMAASFTREAGSGGQTAS